MPGASTSAFLGTDTLIQASYFVTAVLFIVGLKRMSSPVTARSGILWAGAGMLVATLVTFAYPGMSNYPLIGAAIVVGAVLAWWSGKRIAMTNMPQMIALYNGMGGGAAAAIAAVELYSRGAAGYGAATLAVVGGLIGAVSFSGSAIAFGKLQGLIKRSYRFRGQQVLNLLLLAAALLHAVLVAGHFNDSAHIVTGLFVLALILGITMTLPIGGADMPVVISLYNALTGLAVGLDGFVMHNAAMIVAGTVVGAAGTLLTQLMAKAMNRSVANVLFSGFGDTGAGPTGSVTGSLKPIEASDVGVMLAFAQKVIIVPGYGMAVAQAQHKIWELCQLLIERGVTVRFAIHPVAGRMPGHMNVLLAEAGVPYDLIADLDEINAEFETADVALIIGANDVVNPVARTDKSSPIYGMPILNADRAKNVIVIKRGQGAGFSGIENALFYLDNTRMLYGDAQKAGAALIQAVKAVGLKRRWDVRNVLGIGLALAALAALPCHGQDAADNTPPSVQALHAHAPPTPDAMLAGAPASAWRTLDPDNTLYMTLPRGRVVIELAPRLAPRYVGNIKKLVRQGFFNGLAIFRVQDNAVVEWGDPTGRKSVGLAKRTVAAEFERQSRDLPFTALPDSDTYAAQVGFSDSFPAARDPVFGRAWLVNCYGMVGAARGNNVDSGGGTALYAVIGGPQRQWDRNTTMVGRVVEGMPLLSTLPRGNGPLGVYMDRRHWVRVESMQIAADLPPAKRTPLEVLRTDTPTFTQYVASLRNRQGPWFKVPAGRVGVCAIPIPVRPAP